ncbi:MAG: hypothetical protein PHU12_01145 [Candidatus Aenigmarchaeota archaeon]|nr:hypothetical protein [Candidatus Aenigmarchaeota archaeon]
MIDLNLIHAILDWILIISLPIETIILLFVYSNFFKSEFKEKILKYGFYAYFSFHFSYTIRALNHIYFMSESIRTFDMMTFLIAMIFAVIFSSNIYKFSENYGFVTCETTEKLNKWVEKF